MNGALHSSEVHTWETPDVLLGLVRQLGRIALDPCASCVNDNPVGADWWMTARYSGLFAKRGSVLVLGGGR